MAWDCTIIIHGQARAPGYLKQLYLLPLALNDRNMFNLHHLTR